jgi:hypothetical protein
MISCAIRRNRWYVVIVLIVHAPTGDKIMGLTIRQMEIHTAEPLVPDASLSEVEVRTEMLEKV